MDTKKEIRKCSNINSALILFFLVLIVGLNFLFDPITLLFMDAKSPYYNAVYTLIGYSLQYFVAVGAPLLTFYLTDTGKNIKKSRPNFVKSKMPVSWIAKHIVICFGLSYAMAYASKIFFAILKELLNIELHAVDFSAEDNWISKLTNLIAMVILAPIFEELLFRGTILRNSIQFGKWSMIIMSGIFFGLWHLNYEQTLYTMTFGIYLAFIYAKTESLIPTIAAHMVFNSFAAVQTIISAGVDLSKIDLMKLIPLELMGFAIIALMLTGIIFFILEIVNHRESYKFDDKEILTDEISDEIQEENKLSGGKVFAVYFSAPVTIITVILLASLTVMAAVGLDV